MKGPPFYAGGLRFSCARCSRCCRHEPGFVFLSEKDAAVLASALEMAYTEFVKTYCRWVPIGGGREQLSLKEKANYDCILWKDGCSVYEVRPLRCRTFPFWPSVLASAGAWQETAASCPGMNRGTLYGMDHIDGCLQEPQRAPVISRMALHAG